MADCTVNPCTWLDSIYASDTCLNWKLQCTPNDPSTILESQGLLLGTGTVLGQNTAGAISNAIQSAVVDPITGSINWFMVGLLGLAGYLILKEIK